MSFLGMHMRTYFSLHHIKHAGYFSRQAYVAGRSNGDQFPVHEKLQVHANATGALFSSTAFVEATINELFSKNFTCHNEEFSLFTIGKSLVLLYSINLSRSFDIISVLNYGLGPRRRRGWRKRRFVRCHSTP